MRRWEPDWCDITDVDYANRGYLVEEDMAPFAHQKPDNQRFRHCRVSLGGEVREAWVPGLPTEKDAYP